MSSPGALVLSCRRLREVLPELEARITPALGWRLLLWAAASKPHTVAKSIAPPYSLDPDTVGAYGSNETPLHIATQAGKLEIATLLLAVGADPVPLGGLTRRDAHHSHLARMMGDLEMVKLLLDRGAPISDTFGADGCSENALHNACDAGNPSLVTLLLDRGADIKSRGHYETPLAFAVRRSRVDVVQLLLNRGADASVTVPLYPMLDGNPPHPRRANLLYIAMDLRHPSYMVRHRRRKPGAPVSEWTSLPLDEEKKRLIAILLANGASKNTAMETMSTHLAELAEAAGHSEQEYLEAVTTMLNEAADVIPDVQL